MVNNVLFDYQRKKIDNSDDTLFYSQPRFVQHLDEGFRERLTSLYKELIPKESIVLDLMSSWVSHLPSDIKYDKVIGHGLNEIELKRNIRLDEYWIQDINKDQNMPLENNSINTCLVAAGWQYLQYPERVAKELKRVIKPGGQLIISFTNRAFWTKSPLIWSQGDCKSRINYIKSILIAQGWEVPKHISQTPDNNLLFQLFGRIQDPFNAVIASR